MTTMKRRTVVRAGLAGALLHTAGARAQGLRKVTIALAGQSMIAAIPKFSKELGLFDKRGIDIAFVTMDSANAAATALIGGSVDYAFAGPVELITARSRGRELVTIANTYGGLGGSLVLAKSVADKLGVAPNAPVAERLKALKGLTLASPSATSAYTVSYKAAAANVGSEPKFTYMAMPAMQAALESGAIQGFVASAPFWVLPIVAGSAVLWISGPGGDLPAGLRPLSNSVLLTTRAVARANADLVKSITGVFADFVDAVEKRPAEVKVAVAKVFPNVDARTLDLLFESESQAWKARPLTAADIVHEIAYSKLSGISLQLDGVEPASMVWP